MCFGNATYIYLTVSFVEILKGFTPVVTMMVQVACGGEKMPSWRIGIALLMISVGTAVSSLGELRMNTTGLILMLLSIYCEATRLMLTQKLLKHRGFGVLEGLYYLSPASGLFALGASSLLERHKIDAELMLSKLPELWPVLGLNLLLGFSVNLLSFLVSCAGNRTTRRTAYAHPCAHAPSSRSSNVSAP